MPWKPVAELEQARVLTTTGVISLAVIAILALLYGLQEGIVAVFFAIIYAGCAVGVYFNSRAASSIGFAFYLLNVVISLLSNPEMIFVFFIWAPLILGSLAGLRGTFATNKLGGGVLKTIRPIPEDSVNSPS
jgi:hypothetical protein